MTTTNDRPSWRDELRFTLPAGFRDARERCGCGHTRAGHAPDAGACELMCCACEIFRGEADR